MIKGETDRGDHYLLVDLSRDHIKSPEITVHVLVISSRSVKTIERTVPVESSIVPRSVSSRPALWTWVAIIKLQVVLIPELRQVTRRTGSSPLVGSLRVPSNRVWIIITCVIGVGWTRPTCIVRAHHVSWICRMIVSHWVHSSSSHCHCRNRPPVDSIHRQLIRRPWTRSSSNQITLRLPNHKWWPIVNWWVVVISIIEIKVLHLTAEWRNGRRRSKANSRWDCLPTVGWHLTRWPGAWSRPPCSSVAEVISSILSDRQISILYSVCVLDNCPCREF